MGVGAATKRAIRGARHAWDESMARRHSPYELFKWKALAATALQPDYFMHVLPSHKLVYVEVPKAASSFVLGELRKRAGPRGAAARNVHQRSESGFSSPLAMGIVPFIRLIDDPSTFIFTTVRNPYARLVSCYFDKFAPVSIGDGSYISNTYLAYGRMTGRSWPDGGRIAFDDFVAFACATAPFRFDGHWCRQTDIVPATIAPPHAILRVETLGSSLPAVLDRVAPSQPSGTAQGAGASVATDDPRLRAVLSQGTAALIREAYADDFARFGYSAEPPRR